MNKIYCSTGMFTGKRNDYNHRLVIEYGELLKCDGFEIMIFEDWYNNLNLIIEDYKSNAIICPIVHSDKKIGGLLSNINNKDNEYIELWKINCKFGAEIGAKRIVAHLWGRPDSDKNPQIIYERCGKLIEIAKDYNLDLVVENAACTYGSPLNHLEELIRTYPELNLVIDTKFAQFHSEIAQTCKSQIWINDNVKHIHISEYSGNHKDWNSLSNEIKPGNGDINYTEFFNHLNKINYSHSLTLESSAKPAEKHADSLMAVSLNESLGFIKNGIFKSSM